MSSGRLAKDSIRMEAQTNRSHRERRSGAKVNKKKAAARSKHADGNKNSGSHNPRAFTVKSAVRRKFSVKILKGQRSHSSRTTPNVGKQRAVT